MHQATLLDFEIPKKYGLRQTIADSIALLEGYLSEAYEPEPAADLQHVAISN